MKNYFISYSTILFLIFSLFACQKKALCPAYLEPQKGTISKQDTQTMEPDEIRKQSKQLLDSQDSYIQVKRDKKTGLITGKRRVKKNKNNALTDKNFSKESRFTKGLKIEQKKPKTNASPDKKEENKD
jgi:hypothetical protein